MYPVRDVDALLLIATALAAKRRPAALVEIVAAIDLLQVPLPAPLTLLDAFAQLGRHGLIRAQDAAFVLNAQAEQAMAAQPKRASSEEKIFCVRDALSTLKTQPDQPAVVVTQAALDEALLAHKTASDSGRKNLLAPKPIKEADNQRPGQRLRKPLPARKARSRS